MHIAFLSCEYPPLKGGGIATFLQGLGRALVSRGHRVTVLGWGKADEWRDHGVTVRMLSSEHPPKLGWLVNRRRVEAELRRMVGKEQLAIVEAADWCGMAAGVRPGCPLVIRCHGSAVYFAWMMKERVRVSVRAAEWLALHGASSVAACSSFTARSTRNLFSLRDPVRTIYNGVDLERFRADPSAPVEPATILSFGSIVRKKGVLDLAQAFSRLHRVRPDAILRVIGRDSTDTVSGSASTWKLCGELLGGAASRVQYLGALPYDEMAAHIRAATCCVFPSHAEALPMAWLEAMACGKAILGYDVGWGPEVIEHEVSGLLTPENDIGQLASGMGRLLEDAALRERVGLGARRRVEEKFSLDGLVESTLGWYREVLRY